MLGKLKSMISQLRSDLYGLMPVKGMAVRLGGAGASAPSVTNEYNYSAIARVGVGAYRVTLAQDSVYGSLVIDNGFPSVNHVISPTATTDLYTVDVTKVSDSQLDVKVYEVYLGGGFDLVKNPYDLQIGDYVHLMINMNIDTGRISPP